MKNVNQIIFILLISTIQFIYSQGDPLLHQLDSPSVKIRSNALNQIIDKNLDEYAEELEKRIFNQPEPFMIDMYLRALQKFESPNLYNITQKFIELTDNFSTMDPPKDPLESKLLATEILFSFGDYSSANYVFQILERDRPKINGIALALLKDIILYVPIYQQQAKSELLHIVNNIPISSVGSEDFYRFKAINTLSQIYGADVQENVINLFRNDPFMPVRSKCLKILFDFNYESLNQLLIERLFVDVDWTLRVEIADALLKHFGKPSDLKAVIDYQPTEQETTARGLMGNSIQSFIPPRPISSANKMIDTLRVYTGQLYQYGWITDNNTYLYYLSLLKQPNYQESILKAAKRNLKNINILLTKVEADLSSGLLTEEGYKFMHYYSIYIKEELQKIIDGSTLRIK